jgi:hypothetical protein
MRALASFTGESGSGQPLAEGQLSRQYGSEAVSSRNFGMLNQGERECTPHRWGSAPRVLAAAAVLSSVVAIDGRPAAADEVAPRAEELAQTADLDGTYLALGPRGGAVYSEDAWDGAFGAELFLYRYRGAERLSILGASAGMVQLSELDGGHAFAEVGAGVDVGRTRGGVALGFTARLSPIRHPRWGGHATLWAFAGAIPYIRVGALQDTGMFADFGIRLALPALRF